MSCRWRNRLGAAHRRRIEDQVFVVSALQGRPTRPAGARSHDGAALESDRRRAPGSHAAFIAHPATAAKIILIPGCTEDYFSGVERSAAVRGRTDFDHGTTFVVHHDAHSMSSAMAMRPANLRRRSTFHLVCVPDDDPGGER
jgi:hypothetical protein